MVIHPREHDLVVATHGRGIQIIDDISPLRALTPQVLDKPVAVLPSRAAVQRVSAFMQDFPGDDEHTAPNPPDGAFVTYYLKTRHIFGTLKVEVLDASGKVVQTLPSGARQGLNRIFWNMRLPAPKSAAAPGLGVRALAGPMVAEGRYTVRVTRGDEVADGTIDLVPDPLGNHPAAARQQRQKLLMQLYDMQGELAYVGDAIAGARDDLRARVTSLKKKTTGEAGGAASGADALANEFDALHKTTVDRTGMLMAADPQLRERVIELYGSIMSYGGAPTGSQVQYTAVLAGQLAEKRRAFDALAKKLGALNPRITAAGEPPVRILAREEFDKKK
jgi:hypothetical protein